ncbi:P-loop containing nucleoside triphosphate hydrolase protein [Syncephalis plumigaleata]|nr:P-loop containing nucleoside triphosphate hydrolase protein [Syncephalis plumigaleata]
MPPVETTTALRLTRQRAKSISQKPSALTPLGVRSTNRLNQGNITSILDKARTNTPLKLCLTRRRQTSGSNKENASTAAVHVEVVSGKANKENVKETKLKEELKMVAKQVKDEAVTDKRSTVPASPFYAAKQALTRSIAATKVIGRTDERHKIETFWRTHVLAHQPGALYISGQPGTGKTALLTEIMNQMEKETTKTKQPTRKVYLNCMSLVDPKDVYRRLLEELPAACVNGINLDDPVQAMRQIILGERRKTLIVIILDEIDHLLTKDQSVLYRLFEWAAQPSARLVLIGIANALDLTERFLPLLCAKNCEPELLNFNPYTVNDIIGILNERLQEATTANGKNATEETALSIQRTAIELCARKVASATGDLRKAMDVFRQAIELAEQDYMTKKRAASSNITVAHVLKVLSGVFGSASVQVIRNIGFQQKLVLGAFLRLTEVHRRRDATVGQLFDVYLSLCQSQKTITPVTRSEFHDLLGMLEASNGLITFGKRRMQEEQSQRIQLNAQPDDIRLAFRSETLLQQMLENMVVRQLI